MTSNELARNLAVREELRTARLLLERGLGLVQRIDGANDFYHDVLLVLATGFERLIKVTLILRRLRDTGAPPDPNELKKTLGHRIPDSLDRLIEQCFDADYVSGRQAAEVDLRFLREDELLRALVSILGHFGQHGRYHNLDAVLRGSFEDESPEDRWESVEWMLTKDDPQRMRLVTEPDGSDRLYALIANDVVACLERGIRAICRLYTLSELHPAARQVSPVIMNFITLSDARLGRRDYRSSA